MRTHDDPIKPRATLLKAVGATADCSGNDAWVRSVKAALNRGHQNYKIAAATIAEAMSRDKELTQKKVSDAIGRSTTWVCRLLQWHDEGCREGSIFGGQHSRNRIAPAQSSNSTTVTDEELGQLCLLGGHSNYVPGQGEATLKAMNAIAACRDFTKNIDGVTREALSLVFRSSGAVKQRFTLEKLATALEKAITAADTTLGEVRTTLESIPREPDFDDPPAQAARAALN